MGSQKTSLIFCLFILLVLLPASGSNPLIQSFSLCRWARRGDVWEAADLMQQMKQEGVQPDIHTYTSFINACCKAGDMLVC